ncbi:hypothetical protein COLSTE_02343 [Collinsella stercoris DSM 13279]|uniref:Uncharacterized protein n=1 Tax=Collinsella stercoris DSM 13279 TaxID=445975 RepID=B6GE07_9ACTN|nr:hypothetical protein COLSTE_02343 [Collinsella stercoris DSM 13279]
MPLAMTVIRLSSMVVGAPVPYWISRSLAAEETVIHRPSTQAVPPRTTSRSTSLAPGQGVHPGPARRR